MLKVEEHVEEGGSACVSVCGVVVLVVVDQREVVLSLKHALLHVERSTNITYCVSAQL